MKKLATKSETADAPTREAGEGVAAVERALSIVAALETSDQPMTLPRRVCRVKWVWPMTSLTTTIIK